MPRRRFVRGISRRNRRRLTWRANANANQSIPNVSGTPGMFSLRPAAGWENTEPTLVRIRATMYGGVTLPPFQVTAPTFWSVVYGVGIVMGNQPNGFLNGTWSVFVPVDLEDEQVLYAGLFGGSGMYGLLDQATPASVGLASQTSLSVLNVDTKSRRKVRNENDDIWLSVAARGQVVTSATISWIMRFLYAVDF